MSRSPDYSAQLQAARKELAALLDIAEATENADAIRKVGEKAKEVYRLEQLVELYSSIEVGSEGDLEEL